MPSDITKQQPKGLEGLPSLAEIERMRKAVLTGSTGYGPKPITGTQSYGAGTPMGDWGTSKYDETFLNAPMTPEQLQDIRYENQPWYDVFANGVGKMLGTAATTFASSLVGIPVGLYTAASEGRWSGLWDNDVMSAISSADEWLEKNMTNYQSQEQQQNPYFRLGDMNWWADNVIKNMGFTLGAAASGAVGAGALGLMSRALNMVNNVSKGVRIGNQIASALFSATGEGMIEARQGVEERNKLKMQQLDDEFSPQYTALDMELQQAAQEYDLERTGLPGDPAYAKFRQKQEELVAKRQELDRQKNAAQQEIEETGRQMGNAILLGNQVFLTLGNIIEFGKGLTKSYDRARHMAEMSTKVKKPAFVGASRVSEDITKGYKIQGKNLGRGIAALKNTITEGQEEMSQQWISSSAADYYDRKNINDYWKARLDQNSIKDVVDGSYDFGSAISRGFKESYGTPEQWEQFLIGAFTGATGVVMPTKVFNQDKDKAWYNPARYFSWEGGAVDDVRQFNREYKQYEDNIKDLNTVLAKGDIKDRVQRLAAHTLFQQDKEYAAEKNDRKAWEDADDKQAIIDIQAFLRAGKLDDLRAIYADMLHSMSDEEIDSIIDKTSYEVSEEEDQKNHDKLMDDEIAKVQHDIEDAQKALSEVPDSSTASDPATAARLMEERRSLEDRIKSLDNKAENLRNEKANYQKKKRFFGPFVTEDGNRTKSREDIRKEIRGNVDELNRKLDSYLDSVAEVQKDTGGKLTKEQEDNLAYLHNLGKESIYRSNNIVKDIRKILPKTMLIKTNKTPEQLSREYFTSDLTFSKDDRTKEGYVEVDTSKMTDNAFANFFMDTIISGANIGENDAASEVVEELKAQEADKDLSKEEQEKNKKEREKAREEKKKDREKQTKKDREEQLRSNEDRIREAFVRDLMDNHGQTLEQALQSKDYDAFISRINDAIDLRSQADSYFSTLNEYKSNPSKVDQDMQKEENKAAEDKKNKDTDAATLQDLMAKSNVDLFSILSDSKKKKNKKGNAAKTALGLKETMKAAEEELAKKVASGEISEQTKEDAERLLNNVIGNYANAFNDKEEEINLPSDLIDKVLNPDSESMIDPLSLLDDTTFQQIESGMVTKEDLDNTDLAERHARAMDALLGTKGDIFDRLAKLGDKMDMGKILDTVDASERQAEKEEKAAAEMASKTLEKEHLKETGAKNGDRSEQIKATVTTLLSSREEAERDKSVGAGEDETVDKDMQDGSKGENIPKESGDEKWHPWMTSTSEVGHGSNSPYQPAPNSPNADFKKKRYDVIRKKLYDLGAFTAIKQGAVTEDMEVGFKVFEDVNNASGDFVVFITDKNGNVIGDMPSNDPRLDTSNRDIRMDAFYAAIREEWTKATPEERQGGMQSKYTSHIDHVLVGKVLYQQDRQSVTSLMNGSKRAPLFAIKTRMGMHTGRNAEGNSIVQDVLTPKTGNPGQPYVLIATPKIHSGEGRFSYYAVPVKTMTVGEAIKNNTLFAKVLRELLENIQDYNVDKGIGVSDAQAAQLLESLLAVANVHVNLQQGSQSKKGLGIHITTYDRKEKTEKHNSWAIYEGNREDMDIDKIMEALSRFSINVSASFINGNVNYYDSLLKVNGDPVDYNTMIAEVCNTNATAPETVNDWFTVRPLISDDKNGLKEVAEKDKKTEWEDVEPGNYKEFSITVAGKSRNWKVEIGSWRVLDENDREITRTGNTHTKEEWEAAKKVAAEVWGALYMKSKDTPYAVMVGGESFIYLPETGTFKTYEELESDPEYNFAKLKNGESLSAAGQFALLERWMTDVATDKELTAIMMKEREEIRQRVTGPQAGDVEVSAQQVGQDMVNSLQEMGVDVELVDDATKAAENVGNDAQLLAIGEFGSNAESPNSAEQETAEIKAKAQADGTFMKAPNGNPSNLTEGQWLQVRTEAFKRWFGDWEKYAPKSDASERLIKELNRIQNSNGQYAKLASLILNNNALPYNLKYFKIDNTREDVKGAEAQWHSLANLIEVLGNNVSQESIDKHLLHEIIHYNTESLLENYKKGNLSNLTNEQINNIKTLYDIISYAKEYLKKDIPNNREKYLEIAKRQNKNLDSRVFYAFDNTGNVEIDEFISEVFTNPAFQEVLNGIPYKETKKTIWNKIKECIEDIFGIPINKGSVLEEALKASTEFITKAKEGYDSVSKVVDENGEPLVVYHHTDNPNLTKFSTEHNNYFAKDGGTKEAIFFDEEKTGTLNRKYDLPVFLNIRELNEYNETKQQLHDRGTTYREIVNNSAKNNNRTGGVHMNNFDDNGKENQSIWIIHNPSQVKSATDNSGEFSNENPDINMLKVGGKILGFEYNGKLYLQKDAIDPNLPMHEYTHLWDKVVKEVDPRLWAKGKKLMQTDAKDLWKEIAESEDYGKRWQREGKTGEELEDLIASEVHARMTGKSFEDTQKKYNKSTFAQLKQWMLDVLKSLARTFGMSSQEVDALTLKDWNRLTIRDFMDKSVNMQTLQQFRESQKDHTTEVENTLKRMKEDEEKFTLVRWDSEQGVYVEDTRNGDYYRHDNGTVHARVSNVNAADNDIVKANEEARFSKIKGPGFVPSTGAGNVTDRFLRDSFAGGDPLYGLNLSNAEVRKDALKTAQAIYDRLSPANIARKEGAELILAMHQVLWDMNQNETVGEWEIDTSGIVAEGMVSFDSNNIVNVAGTIDILLYNKKKGKYQIVDMKTHRADIYKKNGGLKDDAKTRATLAHWRAQQTMYKQFLEAKYGIDIEAIKIFPMTVSYSTNYKETNYSVDDNGVLMDKGIPVNIAPKYDGKLIELTPKERVNYTIGQLPDSVKRLLPNLNPVLSKPKEKKVPVKDRLIELRDRVPEGRKLEEFIKDEYKDKREVKLLVSNLESNKGSSSPILMTSKSQDLLLNAIDGDAIEVAVTEAKALKEKLPLDIPLPDPAPVAQQDIDGMFNSGILDIDYRDLFNELSTEIQEKIAGSSAAAGTFNEMARNGDDADDISTAIEGMPLIRHKKAVAAPYKVLDIDKEMKWLSNVLPQLSTSTRVQLVKGLIKCSDGSDDFGRLQDNIILIGTQAGEGTVFHEAFHAVVQLLLTDEEIDKLYEAAKKRWGDLNPVVLEEKLADEFEYHTAGMEYEEGIIRRFFRKLWEAIKALTGNRSYIDTLFRNINNGVYAGREFRDDRNNVFSAIRKEQREHTKDYAFLSAEDRGRIQDAEIDKEVYDQMSKDQKEYLLHCVI